MRIRRGGVDRLMRRFLTGTVLIQEELLREGKLSGAEELAVRVAPKQKAARTWQPAREVRHPDTRGQTSPWRP